MNVEGLLREITDLIVRACEPDKIVLFGSFAKRQQTVDSDLDLLVIGRFCGSPHLRDLELRQLLYGYPIGIDLHVATPREIESESRHRFGFVRSVLHSGHVLYTKDEGVVLRLPTIPPMNET